MSAVFFLALAPATFAVSAKADPAYGSDTILDVFIKAKLLRMPGAQRRVCFQSDASCGAKSAAHFDLLVNFEFDSDRLTDAARENLSQFARALTDPQLRGTKFDIDGHADATGTESYNTSLSERRAEAVAAFLASQGVDPSTLAAHGFGPLANQPRQRRLADARRAQKIMEPRLGAECNRVTAPSGPVRRS